MIAVVFEAMNKIREDLEALIELVDKLTDEVTANRKDIRTLKKNRGIGL